MANQEKTQDRSSRFVWQSSDIVIIRVGEEKPPATDVNPDKPAPDADAPPTSKDLNDDQDNKGKP